MNKEYWLYKDNDVVVEDENGKKRVIKYQDNIHDLLIQENMVEILETKLVELEQLQEDKKLIKNNNKKATPAPLCGGIIGLIAGSLSLPYFFTNGENPIVNTVFGPMSVSELILYPTASLFIPFCGLLSLNLYGNYKQAKKQENGIMSELSFLKLVLDKEKEKLVELQNNKTASQHNFKNEFECIPINGTERLKIINGHLDLYYDCGYNENKYLKLYNKGILSMKLEKSYNKYGIKLIEEYIEKKSKEKMLTKGCN